MSYQIGLFGCIFLFDDMPLGTDLAVQTFKNINYSALRKYGRNPLTDAAELAYTLQGRLQPMISSKLSLQGFFMSSQYALDHEPFI